MTPTTPRSSRARTAADRPFRRRAVALVGALALAALGTGGLAAPADADAGPAQRPGPPERSGPDRPDAGPRPERHPRSPRTCRSGDPDQARRDRGPAGRQPVRRGARRRAVQARARTAPTDKPLIFQVGYYTEVAGLGPQPRRRRHQRPRRRLQPVHDRRQLHRAEQLLALDVQPHHQRDRRRRLPGEHRVLGRLAGRAAAPGERHRQT